MLDLVVLFAAATSTAPAEQVQSIRVETAAPGDPDGSGITYNDPADPKMSAARAQAKAQLPEFLQRLSSPAPDESNFVVKFDLQNTGEFIWATDLVMENGRLTGVLANTPLHPDYRMGQRVPIPEAAIADWGYFRGNVMQGNFTTRVQLDVMAPEEAREVRQRLGW
jgi:uncharacterized protein YegJ (DUF2314 family)